MTWPGIEDGNDWVGDVLPLSCGAGTSPLAKTGVTNERMWSEIIELAVCDGGVEVQPLPCVQGNVCTLRRECCALREGLAGLTVVICVEFVYVPSARVAVVRASLRFALSVEIATVVDVGVAVADC